MQSPPTSWIALGIVHFMAYPSSASDDTEYLRTLEILAADEFFNLVEVRRPQQPETAKQVAALLASAGMGVGVGSQPTLLAGKLDLGAADDAARAKAAEDVKQSIGYGAAVGARIVAVLSGPDVPAEKRPEAMERTARSLVECCRYAKQRSADALIHVSLETFDRDVDKRRLIGPTTDAIALADRVKQEMDNFGLTLDLSHLPMLHETPEHAISTAGEHLIHAHVGNCVCQDSAHPAYGDQHPGFGIAGGENGVEELVQFIRALERFGYLTRAFPTPRPVITIEVKPQSGEKPEWVVANAKRAFAEAWGRA